jgi:hypothetical protein
MSQGCDTSLFGCDIPYPHLPDEAQARQMSRTASQVVELSGLGVQLTRAMSLSVGIDMVCQS